MKSSDLPSMTTEDLIAHFVQIAIDQDTALTRYETAAYNRLFRRMRAIEDELKARPGDQRRELLPLYNYPNMQVRLQSAMATLAINPEAARQHLQIIADSRHYPQAGDAGMALVNLERGIFKPT